jgi:glycosyltransferase involved in cell wall biosynthesis
VVVFVGALGHDHRKGFNTLWAAWQQLCCEPGQNALLLVAGDGRSVPVWQQRITAAGLGDRIRLLGFTQRVADLLAAADLLVSPVRYEPYGLNVQEAICRGLPALVSACAGVAERYPLECTPLLLKNPEDADDLAGRLRLWRSDPKGWRERFRPFSETLRSYTWRHMAERIVELADTVPPPTDSRVPARDPVTALHAPFPINAPEHAPHGRMEFSR